MKQVMFLFCFILFVTEGLAQFAQDDGPWYAARVRDIAIGYAGGHSVIYAVNLTGGNCTYRTLVKSTDGGNTWQHISSIQSPISVATRRDNPDIVFVSALNVGILKSTNGGSSWTVVSSSLVPRRIAIARANPNFIYAGLYSPQANYSLYYSGDGGTTWSADQSFTPQTSVTSIVFEPVNTNIYVTGVSLGLGAPHKGIWKTGIEISNGMDNKQIAAFAIQENNPQVLYAGTISPYGEQSPGDFKNNVYESTNPYIYKSTDGGTSWSNCGFFYASGIAIDPTNSNNILVSNDAGIMKSTNGGGNWSVSVNGVYDKNVFSLASDASNGAILAGTFHSLYKTTNAGATWVEQTRGIEKPPTMGVAVNDGRIVTASGRTKCGSNYDVWIGTIHRRTTSTSPWLTTFANSGFDNDIYFWNDIKAHEQLPQTIFACGSYSPDAFYVQTPAIFKSTDDGLNWSTAFLFSNGVLSTFSSIGFDHNNTSTVFVAGTNTQTAIVAKTTNSGINWTTMYPGMTSANTIVLDPTTTGSQRIIYVGGSIIRKSTNDGATWSNAGSGVSNVTCLGIDPQEPRFLYAGNSNGIFKTDNGGDSWTAMNYGLNSLNVTSIFVHPVNPNVLYASIMDANGRGHIYKSIDAAEKWDEISTGTDLPPNARVNRLTMDSPTFSTLYAATDSGVYHLRVVAGPPHNLTATSILVAGVHHPKLAWQSDCVPCVSTFKIYRRFEEDEVFSYLASVNSPETSYVDLSVEAAVKFGTSNVYYYVTAVEDLGESDPSNTVSIMCICFTPKASLQPREEVLIPEEFFLYPNHPNPFNPATQIKYALPEDVHVVLRVFDVLGREVATLVDEFEEAGYKYVQFDASKLPSGVYFYKLQAGKFTNVKKMLLAK